MKHGIIKTRIFFIYVLFFAFFRVQTRIDEQSSFVKTSADKMADKLADKKEQWITIFVHGIMSIQPYLSTGLICKLFNDSIRNTLYADVVSTIRKNTLFSCNQLMQGVGLHKIDIKKQEKYTASQALAILYNQVLKEQNTHENDMFYTFGWSGLLSKKARRKAAKQLFFELEQEIKRLAKIGYYPKIRLIGYSHGANVCLNVAAVKNKHEKKHFLIDELILLGCPIQVDNDFLVNDPFFKKVYNFYSRKDRIQKRDCFSSKAFFSDRRFCNRSGYGISKKVTQVQIKITRIKPGISHARKKNVIYLTQDKPNAHSSRALQDESPGHMELWFFGWTPRHYRKTFILYPYPVLLFLPIIIQGLKKSGMQYNGAGQEIIVDIRPDHEMIIIKSDQKQYIQPFQFHRLAKKFASIAEKAQPEKYSKEIVENHIYYHKKKIKNERLQRGIRDSKAKRMRK